MIHASRFMPILEQTDLLEYYLQWLLRESLAERAHWSDLAPDLPVAINLPPRCLRNANLPTHIDNALRAAGLRADQLTVELPADAVLRPLSTVDTVLNELHTLGLRIAIDNFGRGTTTLDRLLHLPATDIKIAPEVTGRILTSRDDHTIIRIAREIADGAGLQVTATGVRTEAHLHAAHAAGAHAAQGDALTPALLPERAHLALRHLADTSATPGSARIIPLHPSRDPQPD
jgi:EAL domain-containing protein (putative c-di-GMP-specific phosphodiesterase class I)